MLITVCVSFGCLTLYADNNIDYNINMSDIECIFSSNIILNEDFVIDGCTSLDLTDVIKFGVNLDFYDDVKVNSIFDNIECYLFDSVKDIKVIEIEEEYLAYNYLGHRNVAEEVGNDEIGFQDKFLQIFGYPAMYWRREYFYPQGEEQALSNMTSYYIIVWDLDENGEWYQNEVLFTSHKNLKKTFLLIFNELLDLPEEERVPIHSIGCYNYRDGDSCHTCGVAVDINWYENAEMDKYGRITCGGYWKPYEDIYSIPSDSKMVEIFTKYGFGWGGLWTDKKDYMHFSYFNM